MQNFRNHSFVTQTSGPKGHITCTWVQCATFLTDQPGWPFLVTDLPKLGRGCWDLASCQLSLKSNNLSQWETGAAICFFSDQPEKDKLIRARTQHPLPSLCFSGWSEKQDGRPGLWLAETFSTSPLKSLNRIQQNLTGSKISTSSTKIVFFGQIRITRWPPWPSDWLRHFRLLLWYRWTEFNETWQEARSQPPLPSLCFLGRSEKQDGCPCLLLAETFSTSPLKPLNGIQGNLTGSKISTSSTKFVFFRLIGKTRWPPWPLIGWDIFDFSSETAKHNSKKLDRKQDLNVLYQVCVFFCPISIQKCPPWPIPQKRWHIVLGCTICGPFGLLFPS